MHNNAFEHCVSRALVIYQPWWKQREECILYCLQLKDDDLSAFQAAKNWRSSHEGRGEEERRECLLFEEQVLLLSRDSASSKIQDCVGALSCTMYPLLPLWWQKMDLLTLLIIPKHYSIFDDDIGKAFWKIVH